MVGDPRPSTGTQWGRHRPSGDTSPSTVTEGGGDGRNRLPPGSQTPTPGTPTGGRPTPGPTEREHVHSRLFFDCPSWHPYARSHLWSGDEAHSGPRPPGPRDPQCEHGPRRESETDPGSQECGRRRGGSGARPRFTSLPRARPGGWGLREELGRRQLWGSPRYPLWDTERQGPAQAPRARVPPLPGDVGPRSEGVEAGRLVLPVVGQGAVDGAVEGRVENGVTVEDRVVGGPRGEVAGGAPVVPLRPALPSPTRARHRAQIRTRRHLCRGPERTSR